MLENNNLLVGLNEKEERREISSFDDIMSQMVKTVASQFMDEVRGEILSMKHEEILTAQKSTSSGEYMTRKEVMKLLKRCDSTMTKWARRGYLVPLFIGGKYLYRKSDVMKLMK